MSAHVENSFLSACFVDPACVDSGVAAGVTVAHFTDGDCGRIWESMCVLRLAGQVTQEADVLGELFKGRNPVDRQKVIAIAGFDPTTLRFAQSLELLCDEYARREIALRGAR